MTSTDELLLTGSFEDFVKYNEEYDNDSFLQSSEATKFDLDAIKRWLSIRDGLTYTREFDGDWKALDIREFHTKYGTSYIYIDMKNKLWRTRTTASEFYGRPGRPFLEEDT